jgi:regulator of sigma D
MNERHFRLYERIVAIEDSLEALGPIDKLIERIEELEKMVKQTKTVLGFDEACKYTAAKEVPHYKPRGKMLYFNREEIDKWLLQNKQEVIGMVTKIEIDNPKE